MFGIPFKMRKFPFFRKNIEMFMCAMGNVTETFHSHPYLF